MSMTGACITSHAVPTSTLLPLHEKKGSFSNPSVLSPKLSSSAFTEVLRDLGSDESSFGITLHAFVTHLIWPRLSPKQRASSNSTHGLELPACSQHMHGQIACQMNCAARMVLALCTYGRTFRTITRFLPIPSFLSNPVPDAKHP